MRAGRHARSSRRPARPPAETDRGARWVGRRRSTASGWGCPRSQSRGSVERGRDIGAHPHGQVHRAARRDGPRRVQNTAACGARVENGVAEAVELFHLDSLSSPILVKVHSWRRPRLRPGRRGRRSSRSWWAPPRPQEGRTRSRMEGVASTGTDEAGEEVEQSSHGSGRCQPAGRRTRLRGLSFVSPAHLTRLSCLTKMSWLLCGARGASRVAGGGVGGCCQSSRTTGCCLQGTTPSA